MGQVTLTFGYQDSEAVQLLNGLKVNRPLLEGETTNQYLKRVIKELVIEEAVRGNRQLLEMNLATFNPNITTT
jgi:hypothetical protein